MNSSWMKWSPSRRTPRQSTFSTRNLFSRILVKLCRASAWIRPPRQKKDGRGRKPFGLRLNPAQFDSKHTPGGQDRAQKGGPRRWDDLALPFVSEAVVLAV